MIGSLVALAVIVAVAALLAVAARERDRRPVSTIRDDDRLHAAAAAAAAATNSDPSLDRLCARVRADAGWSMAFVTVVGADVVHAIGRDGMPGDLEDVQVKDSLCAVVVAAGKPMVIQRPELARMLLGNCMAGRAVTAYVGVPVRRADSIVGAFAVAAVPGDAPGPATDAVTALRRLLPEVEAAISGPA